MKRRNVMRGTELRDDDDGRRRSKWKRRSIHYSFCRRCQSRAGVARTCKLTFVASTLDSRAQQFLFRHRRPRSIVVTTRATVSLLTRPNMSHRFVINGSIFFLFVANAQAKNHSTFLFSLLPFLRRAYEFEFDLNVHQTKREKIARTNVTR